MSALPIRCEKFGKTAEDALPDWVPEAARVYLSHTAAGMSLRALARRRGCHPSTILRQVRRFENRRDDPLIDDVLTRLDKVIRQSGPSLSSKDVQMNNVPQPGLKHAETASPAAIGAGKGAQDTAHRSPIRIQAATPPGLAEGADHVPGPPVMPDQAARDPSLPQAGRSLDPEAEIMRALHHLRHPDAVLVVAADMPKAVVMIERGRTQTERLDVIDRHLAEVMALRNWISCRKPGRVSCYAISADGNTALLACDDKTAGFLADDPDRANRRIRYGQPESPVAILARRRDKSGDLFLAPELVAAADRLREDFVMAQLDAMPIVMADEFIQTVQARKLPGPNIAPPGTRAARLRVIASLDDLGPGLADIVLRCCCFLQGVEATEAELGWSARSGKIVLRIALQRLAQHYDRLGDEHMMIG